MTYHGVTGKLTYYPSAKPFSFLRCCGSFDFMCGRYRLTKRRMLEIEQYYDIDELADLEIWSREYNIPAA